MKLLLLILPVFYFLFQSNPGRIRPMHSGIDTPIVGILLNDQTEQDTNTTTPPDTIPASSGPRNNLLMEELYNDGTLHTLISGYKQTGGSCCLWSQNLSDSVFNSPDSSMRFEVRRDDPFIANSPRSEENIQSKFEPALNFERWYGLKIFFPTDYLRDQAAEIVTQYHDYGSTGSPPVAMWTQSDHLKLALFGAPYQDYGLIPKGTWVSFVYHIIWDTDPADNGAAEGLIEIWMNGVKMTTKAGANTPGGLLYGNYMKIGIYKWPWGHLDRYVSDIDRRILFIDDWRIGSALATYNDVVPD